jgi:DNA-binding beta-propeller fold protein YncE
MTTRWMSVVVLATLIASADLARGQSFVNFESGHVRPLALSPDGALLFAVNTPDNRLAIYNVTAGGLTLATEVVVGLEPVAVATRENALGRAEAWVVNHLSDSVSVVEVDPANIQLSRVTRTLLVGDEPRDVVIAGTTAGDRAFVTTARRGQNLPASVLPRLTEEGVPRALVWAFAADAPGAPPGGTPLAILELFGDTPRALAVSPDGSTVYAAVFHSGNQTSSVAEAVVSANGGLPPPPPGSTGGAPPTGLIVKFNPANGRWEDEIARDWSGLVPFALPDQDVFIINANATPPQLVTGANSVSGVGTVLFNMAVRPGNGRLYVANTEARNHVRFEPLINPTLGVQGHIAESRITIVNGTSPTPVHLNPHIDYSVPTGAQGEIDASLAFPTDMTFSSDGDTMYVAAFGSGKVAVLDSDDLEAGTVNADHVEVGAGPSGVALDEARNRLYVMNRIDHSLSIVSNADDPALRAVSATVALPYDPSPAAARDGRSFLYDARGTSGHGDTACASCHIFGDFDSLAWDLGDPFGTLLSNPNSFVNGPAGNDFHPMKGPMTTQSLRGMADAGPMHWRGDRTAGNDPGGDPLDEDGAFKKFNPAFVGLLGRAAELSAAEMQTFTDFILSVAYPPNPIRALDNLATAAEAAGEDFFRNTIVDGPRRCNDCHALPFGTAGLSSFEGEPQEFKVPHLRNQYQKVGMFGVPPIGGFPGINVGDQVRGFGFLHDGGVSTIFIFVQGSVFNFANNTQRRNVEAFLLALDTGLRPVVGQQVSATAADFNSIPVAQRINLFIARDDAGDCDLVVRAIYGGESRGLLHLGGGSFQSDRAGDAPLSQFQLGVFASVAGQEQVYTCVPPGSGTRVALDRDEDGFFDRDELDAGSNPADPASIPAGGCQSAPIGGCRQAGRSLLQLRAEPGREKLKWKWLKGDATDVNAFGNPVSGATGYAVCIYAGTANQLVFEAEIAPGANWNATGSGFKYSDNSLASDGIQKTVLKAGDAGKAKAIIKGRGASLDITLAPQGFSLPVTAQLQNSLAECWEAPYSTTIKNDVNELKAKF